MLCLSSLAGVPVCRRPSLNPAALRDADRPIDGASPMRPAGIRRIPSMKWQMAEETERLPHYLFVKLTRDVPI